MSRKKLTNNESFIFNESDVVNPIRSRALSDRSSVQRRLFPKAECLEAPRNPPLTPRNPPVASRNSVAAHNPHVASRNSPLTPRNPSVASRNSPVAAHNPHVASRNVPVVPSSHSSEGQALSHDYKLGLDGPAGDHNATKNTANNATKNTAKTDPSLELGRASPAGDHNITKKTVSTDPSLELGRANLAGDHNVTKKVTTDPSLELGRANLAGNHNATKNTAKTDPSLELGRANLAGDHNVTKKTVTTDPSLEAIMSKLANIDTGSLRATIVTDGAQSKSTTMESKPKPATNKRVLLQVVPKSVSQEVLHPFKADFKKIHVSNNNSALNNNPSMENDLNRSKVTFNNNETGVMVKSASTLTVKPQISPEPGTFLAGPAAADEKFQKRDLNENKLENTETCICLRPLKLVLCPVCGYTTTGRLRKTCQVHPKDLYLLDVDACPRCKETNKSVFVEYDLPVGFKQAVNKTVS